MKKRRLIPTDKECEDWYNALPASMKKKLDEEVEMFKKRVAEIEAAKPQAKIIQLIKRL